MPIKHDISVRLQQLLDDSIPLSQADKYGQCTDPVQLQRCSAWLTAAQNLVHLILADPNAPYRWRVDHVALQNHGYMIHRAVGELAEVLIALQSDMKLGLLASIADRVRAETIDDFLDHADAYLRDKSKNVAGVIAGVVFEDVVRRICRKNKILEKGKRIDDLVSALVSKGRISGIEAKRARVAAHLRTKATHAQWDEFRAEDIRATIAFTREFLVAKLDA